MLRAGLLVSLMIAGSATCAPPSTAGGTRTSNQIITEDQIVSSRLMTVYDVIRKYNPSFLTARQVGMTRVAYPDIYVDEVALGYVDSPPDALRSMNVAQIVEIRLYRGGEVPPRFGGGHTVGLIAITTRR